MPIAVRCACGKEYHFKDEYAGRRAKCPACGQVVRIPGARPAGSPLPHSPLREDPPSRTRELALLGSAGFVVLVGIGLVVYFLFLSGPAPRAPRPAPPSPAAQQPPATAAPATIEAKPPSPVPPATPPELGAVSLPVFIERLTPFAQAVRNLAESLLQVELASEADFSSYCDEVQRLDKLFIQAGLPPEGGPEVYDAAKVCRGAFMELPSTWTNARAFLKAGEGFHDNTKGVNWSMLVENEESAKKWLPAVMDAIGKTALFMIAFEKAGGKTVDGGEVGSTTVGNAPQAVAAPAATPAPDEPSAPSPAAQQPPAAAPEEPASASGPAAPAKSQEADAAASDCDAAVKKLNELVAAAEKSRDKKDLLPLRMALYELDVAVQGKQSTGPEQSARQKARALLAKVKVPDPLQKQLGALYAAGFFNFGDVNAVAEGDAEGCQVFSATWLYCTKYKPVPGLILYKEDMDLIMARAEGIVLGLEKGSVFIGQVTLLDNGDWGRQAALIRKALSVRGGSGVHMEFHEGPEGTIVIARVTTVRSD